MRSKYIEPELLRRIAAIMPYSSGGAFLLCMETGLRISDAVKVRATDIDEHDFLHYTAQKTGKSGRAKVSSYFIMHYVPIKRTSEYLFTGRQYGQPITRQTVYNHVKKACKTLGIDPKGISTHTARKTFAVQLYRHEGLGRTMNALQHRDAATTLLYAMSDDAIPALVEQLEELKVQFSTLCGKLEALCDYVYGDDRYIPIDKKATP